MSFSAQPRPEIPEFPLLRARQRARLATNQVLYRLAPRASRVSIKP